MSVRRWVAALTGVLATGALVVAAALAVLTLGRRVLPFDAYVVLSDSMAPAIRAGSVVVVRPVDASDLGAGDLITFRRAEQPEVTLTHRIVQIVEAGPPPVVVTRGDANPVPDERPVRLEGTGLRYAFSIPHLGYVLLLAQAPAVSLTLLAAPVAGVAAVWLRRVWSPPARQSSAAAPSVTRARIAGETRPAGGTAAQSSPRFIALTDLAPLEPSPAAPHPPAGRTPKRLVLLPVWRFSQ
ncbi:MAG: signal peptidase I [Chloroflexi bacterium]|nr:signal peptidase I [Chloroflexota bacterium]